MPVHELIAFHADRLELSNGDLVSRLGYNNPSIASMLKSGSMKLPIDKVGLAARALGIDPLYLARCIDNESKFNLAPMLEAIANRIAITENEEKLIKAMRGICNSIDIDMESHPDELTAMLNAFATAAQREGGMFDATITRLKGARKHAAVNATAKRNYVRPDEDAPDGSDDAPN